MEPSSMLLARGIAASAFGNIDWRKQRLIFGGISLIGCTMLSIFMRERVPTSRNQLKAMSVIDSLVVVLHLFVWIFCVSAVLVVNASPMVVGNFCDAVSFLGLASVQCVKIILAVILVEKVKTISDSAKPRCRDTSYIVHMLVALLPNLAITIYLGIETITTHSAKICLVQVPLAGIIFSVCYNLVFNSYLTWRYAAPLIKSRHRGLRNRTLRLTIGSGLCLIALLVNSILLVVTGGTMHGYLYLIIGVGMAISICIFIQYTLTWNPMYKNISTKTEMNISRQQAMFSAGHGKLWDQEYCASKAETAFTAWAPGKPMGIPSFDIQEAPDTVFLRPSIKVTNSIISPTDIAEIWSTLDGEAKSHNVSHASSPMENTSLFDRVPGSSHQSPFLAPNTKLNVYEAQKQRADLYTVESPTKDPEVIGIDYPIMNDRRGTT